MDQPQTKRPRRTCNQAAGSKEGRKRQREQVEHSESCLSESGNESCSSDEDDLWRLWDGSVTDDEGGSGMEAYDDHNLHTSCDHCEVIVPAAESMELEAEFEKEVDSALQGMDIVPKVMEDSPAYQAHLEGCVNQLAMKIRDNPTTPGNPLDPNASWPDADDGALFPAKHCAFKGCLWHGDTDAELDAHLTTHHKQDFNAAESWVKGSNAVRHSKLTLMGLYNAAIAVKERSGVPTVGCSVDRRAHRAFAARHSGQKLAAPMCFSCARVLMHDEFDVYRAKQQETSQQPEIQWRRVFQNNKFCGMSAKQTLAALGMNTYMDDYGSHEKGPNLRTAAVQEEMKDWSMTVPFASGPVQLLSCPEDRKCHKCANGEDHHVVDPGRPLCEECTLPVCQACWDALSKAHKRPQLSLANDLWTGYIPGIIYEKKVTYMELLCASVCQPTMMSIQYQCYGWDLRREQVHMQEHRTGARGNLTAFQLPLEDIYNKFQKLDNKEERIQLPRTGKDLHEIVQVVIMAQDGKVDAKAISQATVRRDVVIELIETMKNYGHRNYVDIDMEDVRKHAKDNLVPNAKGHIPTVPEEVVATLLKKLDVEKDRPGKASAPPDPLVQCKDQDVHEYVSVTAVAMEGTDDVGVDMNVKAGTAYMMLADKLAGKDEKGQPITKNESATLGAYALLFRVSSIRQNRTMTNTRWPKFCCLGLGLGLVLVRMSTVGLGLGLGLGLG